MYEAIGGAAFHCRIVVHVRTRIFEFPGIQFHGRRDEPHQCVYSSSGVRACVVSSLVDYFETETGSTHYAISPGLRHQVRVTEESIRSQTKGSTPLFLVIEERTPLSPVDMKSGECCIANEVFERDGRLEPLLIGGREGERFLMAWATTDGAWPEIPDDRRLVNVILACVRVAQETPGPIRKHLDHDGFVTDGGQFVELMHPTASARLSTATPMDSAAYKQRVSAIREAIAEMERDIDVPHLALLVNSMYREDYSDDAYQRLHYLHLWQSLMEAGEKVLEYRGESIKHDDVIVSGGRSLQELTEYRNDIAHGWTDTIDENYVVNLQRTVNELIRVKYF